MVCLVLTALYGQMLAFNQIQNQFQWVIFFLSVCVWLVFDIKITQLSEINPDWDKHLLDVFHKIWTKQTVFLTPQVWCETSRPIDPPASVWVAHSLILQQLLLLCWSHCNKFTGDDSNTFTLPLMTAHNGHFNLSSRPSLGLKHTHTHTRTHSSTTLVFNNTHPTHRYLVVL